MLLWTVARIWWLSKWCTEKDSKGHTRWTRLWKEKCENEGLLVVVRLKLLVLT